MRGLSSIRLALVLGVLFAVANVASAGTVVSTMRNVNAVMQARGFYLVPVANTTAVQLPGDLAPPQTFELIRPNWEKVTIGRLYTSCSCVRLEAHKNTFERGERAIFTMRNVIATPASGHTYALYVQVTRPIRTTLRVDTFVQSSQFVITEPIEIIEVEPVEVSDPSKDDSEEKVEDKAEDATDDEAEKKDDASDEEQTDDKAVSGGEESDETPEAKEEESSVEEGDKTSDQPTTDKYSAGASDTEQPEETEEKVEAEEQDADEAEIPEADPAKDEKVEEAEAPAAPQEQESEDDAKEQEDEAEEKPAA
jgi:AAA ATPase containing von Willebrand factor type A (vWA) domain